MGAQPDNMLKDLSAKAAGGRINLERASVLLIDNPWGVELLTRIFVGFGARVLDGAVIRRGGMLAAGAVLTPGKVVGTGELWAGNPAKLLRVMDSNEVSGLGAIAESYTALALAYQNGGTENIIDREK